MMKLIIYKMNIKKLCKKIDIFQMKPKLYMHKNEKLSSLLGGISTFIVVCLAFIFSFTSLDEVIERKRYTNTYNIETMQKYNPPRNKYPFIFKFDFFETNFSNRKIEDIISVKTVLMSFDSKYDYEFFSINSKFEQCKMNEEFKKYNLEDFNKDISSYKCVENEFDLDDSKSQNLTVIGYYILKCVNSTENNFSCVDSNDIDNYIRSIIGNTFLFDYEIVHNNFGNPFKPKILKEVVLFIPDDYTVNKFVRKQVLYSDDTGYFFINENKYTEFLFDYEKKESRGKEFNRNLEGISFLFLYSEGRRDIHYRRYKRLNEGLSEAYAIIKIFEALCQLIIGFFEEKIYFQKLINLVFTFDNEKIKINQKKYCKLRDKFFLERDKIRKLIEEKNKLG